MSDKNAIYEETAKQVAAVLDGEDNLTARMATVSSLLQAAFRDRFIWTGFYVVDAEKPRELVVGPYQGELGCLRIPFGKGVCGAAAETRETQLIDDVHAFPGHITCDARAESELVVPVIDADGALIAVLDIDSDKPAEFDDIDRRHVERIVADAFGG